MDEQKVCIVCQMPLNGQDDYPEGADMESTRWCKHCGTKDGLHSYDTLLEGNAAFFEKSQGMDHDQAIKASGELLNNSVAMREGILTIPIPK